MSIQLITHDELSPDARLSANLKIAIGHIEAAAWAMQSISTYNDPANGITDADWLRQIAELLGELNPETRSAHCPECGDSQLIFTELVYTHTRSPTPTPRTGGSVVTGISKGQLLACPMQQLQPRPTHCDRSQWLRRHRCGVRRRGGVIAA
jgi:hypothetical protein